MIFINKKFTPDFPKPTKEEIQKTQLTVLEKYGVSLSKKNASLFATQVKELNWWISLKDGSDSKVKIIDELIVECKEIYRKKYKKELTDLEAVNCAKTLFDESSKKEIQRIKNDLETIIKA